MRGMQATCGSSILAGYHPPYDATVTERLNAAGAVIVGKTNCDEFAMGSSNENSAYGPVRNPWDTSRVPGGSSGGSAAAVAARIVPAALGSETGGSVRQPAALCGIVGVKPTYGRVSRYGLVAFGSSLDQVSVFGLTVRDAALVLRTIAGRDERDATTADVEVPDYVGAFGGDLKGARIGVPSALLGEGLDADVRARVEAAVEAYRELGAEIVDVELPHAKYSIAVYYIIATAEASSNLARYDGVRYGFRAEDPKDLREMYRRTREEGFGAEVKRRIMLGTYVLSSGYYDAYYLKAQQVRTLIQRDFLNAFEQLRRGADADEPHARLPPRREDGRPALDVPLGHLHLHGEPRGRPRRQRPLRAHPLGPARRLPTHGPPLGRVRHPPPRTRLRAGAPFDRTAERHGGRAVGRILC